MDHWRDSTYISTSRSIVDRRPSTMLSIVRAEMALGSSSSLSTSSTNIEDTVFNLYEDQETGLVNVGQFLKSITMTGVQKNEPRLKETIAGLRQLSKELTGAEEPIEALQLSRDQFVRCIAANIVLINRILRNKLIIPDWTEFKGHIEDIFTTCESNEAGKNAEYIEQLARVDSSKWACSVCTVDGQRFSLGSYQDTMCIQSCSKVFNYAKVLHELGAETVHNYIGQEPSGRQFNELTLDYNNKPHNPFINAGAIVVCSLLETGPLPADRYAQSLKYYKRLAGGSYVGFNNAVYLSERSTADRNIALAYYMRENNCFPSGTDVQETLDFYFQLCSVELTSDSGAVMAASLANGGICPITDDPVLNASCVRDVLSLMHSCGMYDYSGQFAFKELVKRFNFHNYDNLKWTERKLDPRRRMLESKGQQVVNLLFSAANGDVTAMRRYLLQGVDLALADYDSRTALHLACAEGHEECVKFLLKKGRVDPESKDRWGHTPLDEAEANGHKRIARMLRTRLREVPDRITEDEGAADSERESGDELDAEDDDLDSGHGTDHHVLSDVSNVRQDIVDVLPDIDNVRLDRRVEGGTASPTDSGSGSGSSGRVVVTIPDSDTSQIEFLPPQERLEMTDEFPFPDGRPGNGGGGGRARNGGGGGGRPGNGGGGGRNESHIFRSRTASMPAVTNLQLLPPPRLNKRPIFGGSRTGYPIKR